jgi:hypothetical protein
MGKGCEQVAQSGVVLHAWRRFNTGRQVYGERTNLADGIGNIR